ncbi:hypothetical protein HPB50_011991 [Hyalomma asiaticum]|uniref:Uncharacterized protein n=1 Tax=Hyalomma asiaticum TaxID=266040 RepID=A0ACB7TLD5_HYAAI|nr:hypothetical protein HPB50_011991 [Hyalomma asiaticum]
MICGSSGSTGDSDRDKQVPASPTLETGEPTAKSSKSLSNGRSSISVPGSLKYSSDFTELNTLLCWIAVVIPSQRGQYQVVDNTWKLGQRCYRYRRGRTDPIMALRLPRHVRRTLLVHQRHPTGQRDSTSLGLAAPYGAP